MLFVAQNPPPPPAIVFEVRVRIASPAAAAFVVPIPAPPTRVRLRVDIPDRHFDRTYLSLQERIVRQGKYSGAPPAVCTATVCAQSVWEQLGRQDIRDPFERP
ncbi:MAG TPA: hypothetical protein VKC15_15125 [Gemmatimonadales bacterium]|nr:hypothetical protein [Gemmatimonadales bacterium]